MNKIDLAWAAGLFEGEGCFSFSAKNKKVSFKRRSRAVKACVTSTDEDVIQRFHQIVKIGNSYGPYAKGGKPFWVWSAGRFEDVQAVIAFLWPWLCKRRREKCKIVLSAYHNYPSGSH